VQIIIEFDFVWAGQQNISFVVKPVPRAAAHAVTRLPVAQQLVDVVGPAWGWQLVSTYDCCCLSCALLL
jgi:hypothetical protein